MSRKALAAVWASVLLAFLCVAGRAEAQSPQIAGTSPTLGGVGASVWISGSNFGSAQGSSTVTFNGVTATASSWSATGISAAVPSGATTGNIVVTVSGIASNGTEFNVVTTPQIAGTSPTQGGVGASVWISGSNFRSAQGSSTVSFNGVPATPASWSNTGLSAPVPPGATTGNIVVTVGGVASNGSGFSVVATPQIAGTSPTQGGVGASVWISGSNFGSAQGSSTVTFNGVTATASSWSATGISAAVPSGATTGNIVVTVSGIASNGTEFNVVTTPQIAGTSPTQGGVGASVWISGSNFGSAQGSSTVTFNGVPATPASWSNTGLGVPVPSGATTGNIVVTVGGVASNGSGFSVVATPQIAGTSPTLGGVGASVWISGSNFGSAQGSSTVTFNGVPATASSWSATGISAAVPSGATTGNIVVTVSGLASNGTEFNVVTTPQIAGMSPTQGGVGTNVWISGSNFGSTQGSSTVTFDGVTATPTNWSNTGISVPLPAGAVTGPVVVTVNGAPSNGPTFVLTGPAISGLSSHIGAVGDSLTIYGANFGATQQSSTVTFNGMAATPTGWNNIAIVVPVPAGATTGPITVAVLGASNSSGTFTVGLPDTITGVSIASPSDGAVVSTPYAAVTGTVTGSIAGIDPIVVTCNNSSASLTTTNFSCNPPLSAGVNSISVVGTDSAGDTQTATISVTLGMQGPISIQVTPPNANMLVGGTQAFTAVDDRGVGRPDATWTVSDSTIASFVSGSPNTLMADAVGQVTLTATVGGVSAQTTVTVLSGTSLPVGTVLWSAPPVANFTTQNIIQAVPTADGPDLYSVDTDPSGDLVVRAFKSDGEQMWTASPGLGYLAASGALGDNNGGIVVWTYNSAAESITDFDPQTGNQKWQYSLPASFTSSANDSADTAVGLDGTLYFVEDDVTSDGRRAAQYLDAVNGTTGTLMRQIPLPASNEAWHPMR